MPNYRVVYDEYHKLTLSYIQEFDTSDQSTWDEFIEIAESNGVDIDVFPKEAPADPKIWFELISQLPSETYADKEEDLWTMTKGGYDTSFRLEDDDGNTIDSFEQ